MLEVLIETVYPLLHTDFTEHQISGVNGILTLHFHIS